MLIYFPFTLCLFSSNAETETQNREERGNEGEEGVQWRKRMLLLWHLLILLALWRTTVMITLGNESYFSAGQTVADIMSVSL